MDPQLVEVVWVTSAIVASVASFIMLLVFTCKLCQWCSIKRRKNRQIQKLNFEAEKSVVSGTGSLYIDIDHHEDHPKPPRPFPAKKYSLDVPISPHQTSDMLKTNYTSPTLSSKRPSQRSKGSTRSSLKSVKEITGEDNVKEKIKKSFSKSLSLRRLNSKRKKTRLQSDHPNIMSTDMKNFKIFTLSGDNLNNTPDNASQIKRMNSIESECDSCERVIAKPKRSRYQSDVNNSNSIMEMDGQMPHLASVKNNNSTTSVYDDYDQDWPPRSTQLQRQPSYSSPNHHNINKTHILFNNSSQNRTGGNFTSFF